MLLVVCATAPEADAVLAGLDAPREAFAVGPYDARAAGPVTTLVCGIGPAAAAAATAVALTIGPYDAAVSIGIAGGFGVPVGTLVVADPITAADVGVADNGWHAFAAAVLTHGGVLARALGALCGPVLTVSTVTSDDRRRDELTARFPGALAEAMEGYGTACAATAFGVPAHEVRAVSNAVGQRDRGSWKVTEALTALTEAIPALLEVLEP